MTRDTVRLARCLLTCCLRALTADATSPLARPPPDCIRRTAHSNREQENDANEDQVRPTSADAHPRPIPWPPRTIPAAELLRRRRRRWAWCWSSPIKPRRTSSTRWGAAEASWGTTSLSARGTRTGESAPLHVPLPSSLVLLKWYAAHTNTPCRRPQGDGAAPANIAVHQAHPGLLTRRSRSRPAARSPALS